MTVQVARVEERFKSPGPQPNGLHAANDGLWYIDQVDLKVYKLDYKTGAVLFEAQTDTEHSSGITFGNGSMWISSTFQLTIAELDPTTGKTIAQHESPGNGVVAWAADQENGRVTGVKTTDGTLIQARHFVASGLNPQQTFLELLDADVLPHAWRAKAQAYRYNLLAPLFGLYANLRQPPQYTAAQELPHLNQAFMVILGLNDSAQFKDIIQAHEQGTLPPPVMWGSCPTQFDPTQAPLGQHTAFMWEKTPYALYGNASRWDRSKERHGRRLLAQWQRYAPNLETAVIDWYTRSPLDTERSLPNMRGGDLLVGELNKGQTGYHRPFAGAGHYRGHLQGLYLCGSSCHPGGNITGLPGYNCAQILLHDLGCPAPWAPPPLEHHLAHL